MELTAPGARDATGPARVVPAAEPSAPSGEPPADGAPAPKRQAARFGDVVRSELIKFRSTRPGPLIVVGSLVAGVGTAVLFANSTAQRYPGFDKDQLRSFDPTFVILRARILLAVSLGVLSARAVTSEYGTGTIVPSLAAVPDRARLFSAKTVTTAGISLTTALATGAGAFLAGQAIFKGHGVPYDTFGSPGAARAVLGGGLYATAAALLGLGIGTLTRSTAGAVSTIIAAEWLVPGIGPSFPKPLSDILVKYWPTEAGARVFATLPDPELLGPWAGLGVMAASTAAVLGAAIAVFRKRDV